MAGGGQPTGAGGGMGGMGGMGGNLPMPSSNLSGMNQLMTGMGQPIPGMAPPANAIGGMAFGGSGGSQAPVGGGGFFGGGGSQAPFMGNTGGYGVMGGLGGTRGGFSDAWLQSERGQPIPGMAQPGGMAFGGSGGSQAPFMGMPLMPFGGGFGNDTPNSGNERALAAALEDSKYGHPAPGAVTTGAYFGPLDSNGVPTGGVQMTRNMAPGYGGSGINPFLEPVGNGMGLGLGMITPRSLEQLGALGGSLLGGGAAQRPTTTLPAPPAQPMQARMDDRVERREARRQMRKAAPVPASAPAAAPAPTDYSRMGGAGQFGTQGFAPGLQDYLGKNYADYGYNPTNQTFYKGASSTGPSLTLDQALQQGRGAGFQMASGGIASLRRR